MDFVAAGGGGGGGSGSGATAGVSLSSENGPILYTEPNRTSAIDDIRSVVIYIFIITIFFSFFLILPGIRNDKFPSFLCITTSLVVTSIILLSLFGTSWHVGESQISAAYKAFSLDRIQGDLSVNIGLQSVNITLRAQKYYILHATDGAIIMDNTSGSPVATSTIKPSETPSSARQEHSSDQANETTNPAEELLRGSGSDGAAAAAELEADEVFAAGAPNETRPRKRAADLEAGSASPEARRRSRKDKFTVKRLNVDINYNERFYWIGPNQMRQEHHNALERGLPFPILTVVEYLSQDEGGFSWSRQYRSAGYYCSITLWLSLCLCTLMFVLHCAAPKYGIYTMQILGCLLLFTNLTYATLVPRGEQRLVIPFEGGPLTFRFGWNFWLVLVGGCLSLLVGTSFVLIDALFPNFIFTTVLDVNYDYRHECYKKKQKQLGGGQIDTKLDRPPFYSADSSNRLAHSPSLSAHSIATNDSHRSSTFSDADAANHTGHDRLHLATGSSGDQLRARHQLIERQRQITSSDTVGTTPTSPPAPSGKRRPPSSNSEAYMVEARQSARGNGDDLERPQSRQRPKAPKVHGRHSAGGHQRTTNQDSPRGSMDHRTPSTVAATTDERPTSETSEPDHTDIRL